MHVFINTTHIKKFEKERSLNKCLQLMFSSVSHEFRTPLNAFSNALNLLEYNWKSISDIILKDKAYRRILEQANQQNQKYFRVGMVSSTILLSLVEDILDLAKLEVGTFSLNEEPFLVRKLLEEIDFIFAFQCSQKRLNFKIEADCDVCNTVFVSDHHRIKQVLMNLISNAFKFTNKGGILLRVKNKKSFDGSVFKIINELEFTIKDTGIGIDEYDIPNLFTMFATFNKDRNRQYNTKGTGLGLFISKKIVESLKGKIRIKSKVNQGTEAVFTICENATKTYSIIEQNDEPKNVIVENINLSEDSFSDISDSDFLEKPDFSPKEIPIFPSDLSQNKNSFSSEFAPTKRKFNSISNPKDISLRISTQNL